MPGLVPKVPLTKSNNMANYSNAHVVTNQVQALNNCVTDVRDTTNRVRTALADDTISTTETLKLKFMNLKVRFTTLNS